jgi:DNA-directed DNA polymerase III PolC
MSLADIQPYKGLPFAGVILPAITIEPAHLATAGAKADCSNPDFLKQLCRGGFKSKLVHLDAAARKLYGERVTFELDTIETLGFTNYILMVWDICRFADEKGIPRGPGRGSVGSSLVSYLIGITELDPIVNGLFFTRFLSKARAKKVVVDGITYIDGGLVPDIDCDFSFYRRGEIIEYLNQRYPGQTSKTLTTGTLTAKILIKDVLKVYEGADEGSAKAAADLVDKVHGNNEELEDAMGLNAVANAKAEKDKKPKPENPKMIEWARYHKETMDIAMSLSSLNLSEGQHASAVLICNKPIRDLMPLQLTKENDAGVKELVSAFDMYAAQEIVIKMDILGVRTLDVIDEACKLIGIRRQDIDVNHPSIYVELQDFKHRHGIFQLETFAQGTAATKVKPKNFDQLSAVLAIARPGAIAHLDKFVKYVNEGVYTSIDPLIDDVLRPTGGVCVYQEQLLLMVHKLGMDLDECEGLRKAIGKKLPEKVKEYRVKIYDVAAKNGHRKELADLIWQIAEDSAGYQFNKSHSACYGMITAYSLYLKINYPIQFYWAVLKMARHESKPHETIEAVEKEMRARGFKLLPPHLAKSGIDFTIEDDKSIRYSLGLIRGVSEKSMSKLQSFRDENAKGGGNLFQVFQSLKSAGLNIGVGSALIQAGCLEGYGINRTRLVLNLCTWNLLSDKEKGVCLTIGGLPEVNWDVLNAIVYLHGNLDDKGKPLLKDSRFETIKKKYQPYKEIWEMNRRNERLANFFYEKTVLGYSYSENVRSIYDGDNTGLSAIADVRDEPIGERARFIGFVSDPYKAKTKAGNDGFKMTVHDETGEITVRFFNDKLKICESLNGRLPEENDLVICEGQKKDSDLVFTDRVGIQTSKIYMKLAELKDAAAKKLEKEVETSAPVAEHPIAVVTETTHTT